MNKIPEFFYNQLLNYYKEETNEIIKGFIKRPTTFRVNLLKSNPKEIKEILENNNISYEEINSLDAFIIKDDIDITKLNIYQEGKIYLQSLSSMIPAIILDPKEEEDILDMAASPGGKTTQIATITNNKARILACEKNKIRFERLKYNIEKQGAKNINILNQDSTKLDDYFCFDKILLDSPCSGSGTYILEEENKYFNEKLIKESCNIQYKLLKKAVSLLKPNHELVYSTCSILKCENEEIVKKILKECKVELVPIKHEIFKSISLLKTDLEGTITICPSSLYEGFFIAKLRKK